MLFPFYASTFLSVGLLAQALPSLLGFTAEQKDIGRRKLLSGPRAVEATYIKFGRPIPDNIRQAAAASAAQQGSVAATPETYDKAYLCAVSIGSPAQTLMLDFDTGSSDLWVFSSEQPASQSNGHIIYTPGASTSAAKLTGETWSISYGDGSGASGDIYADKVVIGGVTATSQAVECATSVASSFQADTQNDGLVGLAFDSINTASPQKVPTFMDNVKSSLSAPLFAAYLRKGQAGSYDFGFIDSSKYSGNLTYVPVDNSQGFWGFTTTGYAINGKTTQSSISAIADTGTSLVYLPAATVRSYYANVSGARNSLFAGGYVFPCSSKLPDLGIIIGGATHTIPGSYLNYAPYQGSTCFGGLQSSAGIGINIFGDVFLKSQYVVFDTNGPQIGFAAQA